MKKNILFFLIILSSISGLGAQVNFVWGKQFGSIGDEKTRNLTTNATGEVYIVGKTEDKVGKENFGKTDGFIVKVDSSAVIIWATQIGSEENDELKETAVDDHGNIYVTGYIGVDDKNIPNNTSDVLIAKLNSHGEILWQKQYGTDSLDIGENIVVDASGDIYVIGFTKGTMGKTALGKTDCFILHLNNDGDQLKTLQLGTSEEDSGFGITIGRDSKVYACGITHGNLAAKNIGNSDLFWGVFSKELDELGIYQYGTNGNDYATKIKTDSNNDIFIAGSTSGVMGIQQKGSGDSFLQKWNKLGEVLWTKQFGTSNWDGVNGLAIAKDKSILISGCQNYPFCESFCKMYDRDGNLLWECNYKAQGPGGGTCGKGICTNQKGDIYHAGYTGANLFSNLEGKHDLFLIKLRPDIKN